MSEMPQVPGPTGIAEISAAPVQPNAHRYASPPVRQPQPPQPPFTPRFQFTVTVSGVGELLQPRRFPTLGEAVTFTRSTLHSAEQAGTPKTVTIHAGPFVPMQSEQTPAP